MEDSEVRRTVRELLEPSMHLLSSYEEADLSDILCCINVSFQFSKRSEPWITSSELMTALVLLMQP